MNGELHDEKFHTSENLKPIDHANDGSNGLSVTRAFPSGRRIVWDEYDSLCMPGVVDKYPTFPLDIWHAAADSEGVMWLGVNARIDGDVESAIRQGGRTPQYDDSLRLAISVNKHRKVYRI